MSRLARRLGAFRYSRWLRLLHRQVEYVDDVFVRYLDEGYPLRRLLDRRVTVSVHHIVADRRVRAKHVGLKGLRGWCLRAPDLVEFRVKGRPREWRVR